MQRTRLQLGLYQRGPLAGLSPKVVLLGWISFFADVSSEMLYPLIPVFLTTILGAPVALVGVIEGVAEAVASILKPLAGRWSDTSGTRRRFIFHGYSLSAAAKAILALAYTWPIALVGRVIDRMGKGLRTGARDALLADSVDNAHLGKALGFHRGMDTMGAVVGPLLALLLLHLSGDNLRLVLWLAVVPGLIGAALVLIIREQRKLACASKAAAHGEALPSRFKWFLFVWGVFAFTNSSDVFLLLKAKNLGLATVGIVLLYALYNLTYAITSPALGRLSDILGRRRLLVSGLAVFAMVYCGFAFATSTVHLVVLFSAYGLYMAATEGVSKAFAIDLVPVNARAAASGWLGTVTGIGALVASSAAGLLWDHVGTWAVFALGACGAIITALALLLQIGSRLPVNGASSLSS